MELLSNIFDGMVVFLPTSHHKLQGPWQMSASSTNMTADFGLLLTAHGAVVASTKNERVTHFVLCDYTDRNEQKEAEDSRYSWQVVMPPFFAHSILKGFLVAIDGYSINSRPQGAKRTLEGDIKQPSASIKKPYKPTASKTKAGSGGKVAPKIDSLCYIREEARMHFSDGVFWDATLNQANIANNNNKFYIIQLLECDDGTFAVWNRWGRLGYPGQSKLFDNLSLAQAKANFTTKFQHKTRNSWYAGTVGFVAIPGKYTWLAMEAGADNEEENEEDTFEKPTFSKVAVASTKPKSTFGAAPGPNRSNAMDVTDESSTSLTLATPSSSLACTLESRVADLVRLIFDNSMMAKTVAAMNYDVKKQPLGKLSKLTIKKALGVLKEIEDVLTSGNFSQAKISDCSNRFYTLIPHAAGKTRLPYIDNLAILEQKLNLLDTLNEVDVAAKLKKEDDSSGDKHMHPLDRQYKQLGLELKALDRNSDTWRILNKWVTQTHAPTHTDYKLKILDIFEVDRPIDHKQFVAYEGLSNQTLLWHGSRMANWVGILSQGLRIAPPEAPVTGYMFGKGVYFADSVSKSANYCATNRNDNIGLLMACQVALGDSYDLTAAQFVKQLNPRYQSCKGAGLSHPDPKGAELLADGVAVPCGSIIPNPEVDESELLYNEFIVYDVAQIKFRYFFKFEFQYK